MSIRVIIVDDQELMREGLSTILQLEAGISVVGTASDGRAALQLCSSEMPDVVLMDIEMPVMDGVEATRRIVAEHPNIHVIILTTFDDDERILAAMQAGARTYLLKDLPGSSLVNSIHSVVRGELLMQPQILSRLIGAASERQPDSSASDNPPPDMEPLSQREREVLALMVEGLSNQSISEQLFLSEGTVKNHVSTIYAKLGVRDRTQAVLLALRHGLTSR